MNSATELQSALDLLTAFPGIVSASPYINPMGREGIRCELINGRQNGVLLPKGGNPVEGAKALLIWAKEASEHG